MKKEYLTVTIDTEADHLDMQEWKKRKPLEFNSILKGIPDNLDPIFCSFGVKPVYLLTDDVIINKDCVDLFKTLNFRCELGAHLHFDDIKKVPFKEGVECEFQMLSRITEIFKERIGHSPVSYRAGRFGVNKSTISSLEKLGYSIDTSITPYVDWRDVDKEMDFRLAPDQPYWVDKENITRKGDSGIFEVPVSICPRFLRRGLWLEPAFTSFENMRSVVNSLSKRHNSKNIIVYNMMFHSMEIYKGTSPFSDTERKLNIILDRLKRFFEYCSAKNIIYATLSEIKDCYTGK